MASPVRRTNLLESALVCPFVGSDRKTRLPGVLAALAAVAAALACCVGCRPENQPATRATEPVSQTAQVAEPPPATDNSTDDLGLDPQVPDNVEELNREAFQTCEQLVADLPDRPEAYAVAAFLYNRHGRADEAARYWDKALEVEPRFSPAYTGLGMIAADKGQYEKATELLRKAIQLDPTAGQAYSLLVDVLLRRSLPEEALAVARQYVERFPQAADSHYWLGQSYLDLSRYEEARKSHEEAIRCDPEYTAAYHSLSIACTRLGHRDEARKYRKRFAELKQKEMESDRGRSRQYKDLDEQRRLAALYHLAAGNVYSFAGNLRKAEAHWLRGAAIDPRVVACREALVKFCEQEDRLDDALEQLTALCRSEPESATYRVYKGTIEMRLGHFQAAEASLRKAVELAPDDAVAYDRLVDLHLQYGHPVADVLSVARKAAELSPSPKRLLALSALLDKAGDRQAALAAVEKGLKLEPENQLLRKAYDQLKDDR